MADGTVLTAICSGCGMRFSIRTNGAIRRHRHQDGAEKTPIAGTYETHTVNEWQAMRKDRYDA